MTDKTTGRHIAQEFEDQLRDRRRREGVDPFQALAAAINVEITKAERERDEARTLIKLLVKWYGNPREMFTALDKARDAIARWKEQ